MSKTGAFLSVLMAMMHSAPLMPAANCTEPEIPMVMMSFGFTVLPLSPIWRLASNQPHSIKGLVHASCASSAAASSLINSKSAWLFTPLPTATITSASDMSISFGLCMISSTLILRSIMPSVTSMVRMVPEGSFVTGGAENILYRTVQNCGRFFGVTI